MGVFQDYKLALQGMDSGAKGQKALIRFLRKSAESKNAEVREDAKRRLKAEQEDIARGKRKKTYKDSVTGETKLRPKAGVGGGTMKTPDETARGRMSLLKKKM